MKDLNRSASAINRIVRAHRQPIAPTRSFL
jgi:hypothetical protein